MKINPENIVKRHETYPESTPMLIESYAFQEYQKAIKDLMRYGKVVNVENTDTCLIVLSQSDFKEWKDLKGSHWYLNDKIKDVQ